MRPDLLLQPLGDLGLRLQAGDTILDVDPPTVGDAPVLLTWSENERCLGVEAAQPAHLIADAMLLAWLGRQGVSLPDGAELAILGMKIRARSYRPIPWATPTEFVRKTLSALKDPALARARMARTRRRPADPPYAVRVELGDWRVAYLHQALHRFQRGLDPLLKLAAGADVVIAGTDYDDEEATAAALHKLDAKHLVLVDFVGPVRRKLGLPVRPITYTLERAPERTVLLGDGLRLPG